MIAVTVVDCGYGNLRSVESALEYVGARPIIAGDCAAIAHADCLVIPGQGSAATAMPVLRSSGMAEELVHAISQGVPALGICLGMQLALERSREGPTECLGLVPGTCLPFEASRDRKVPHIGWNTVRHDGDRLFAGIPQDSHFYFVHSYYCPVAISNAAGRVSRVADGSSTSNDTSAGRVAHMGVDGVIGRTEYGVEYASALRIGRFWATQFHPEKSGEVGLKLLRNFLDLAKC